MVGGPKERLPTEAKHKHCSVFSGELFGKKVAVAVACRYLARVLATIGGVFVTDHEKLGDAKYVCVKDRFDINGGTALVGRTTV